MAVIPSNSSHGSRGPQAQAQACRVGTPCYFRLHGPHAYDVDCQHLALLAANNQVVSAPCMAAYRVSCTGCKQQQASEQKPDIFLHFQACPHQPMIYARPADDCSKCVASEACSRRQWRGVHHGSLLCFLHWMQQQALIVVPGTSDSHAWPCRTSGMQPCQMFCIRWKLHRGALCMQGFSACLQIAMSMSLAMMDAALMSGRPMQQVLQVLYEDIWEASSSRPLRCCVSPLILSQERARWGLARGKKNCITRLAAGMHGQIYLLHQVGQPPIVLCCCQ